MNLHIDIHYERFLEVYNDNFLIYDNKFYPIFTDKSVEKTIQMKKKIPNTNSNFYKGFGIDL